MRLISVFDLFKESTRIDSRSVYCNGNVEVVVTYESTTTEHYFIRINDAVFLEVSKNDLTTNNFVPYTSCVMD